MIYLMAAAIGFIAAMILQNYEFDDGDPLNYESFEKDLQSSLNRGHHVMISIDRKFYLFKKSGRKTNMRYGELNVSLEGLADMHDNKLAESSKVVS
jgi:hypothetical protein